MRKFCLAAICTVASMIVSVEAYAASIIATNSQVFSSAGLAPAGGGKLYGPNYAPVLAPASSALLTVELLGDVNDITANPAFGSVSGGEWVDVCLEGDFKVRVGRFLLNDPNFSDLGNGVYKVVMTFFVPKSVVTSLIDGGVVEFTYTQARSVGAGSSVTATLSAVPEPTTMISLGLGSLLAGFAYRRRRAV